ncbi:MAG: RdgB/HAM1 family non-canonical purine NTP pyrophosphatase [Bacteroidetes bacterium]|nr:RdgB/HAM1 family non-canonical purine NTP pyrophosphatase [Bacteroidota bacterium]
MPQKLLISTRNPHKLREIMAILEGSGVELVSLEAFPDAHDVVEDRPTLEGNAAKKAEELFALTGLHTMADDTGLEVDALAGAPGVRSARFAGDEADAAANRRLLLERLAAADDRRARFRTVIALTTPQGTRFFEGTCEGVITREERGHGGFGYDPIFRPDGHAETFAEMDAATKNAISHRGRALAAFADALLRGEVRP